MADLSGVRFEPLGESALCFEAGRRAGSVAKRLRESAPDWITDVVPSFGRVMVAFDPSSADGDQAAGLCRSVISQTDETPRPPTTHVVPVCYEYGEDTAEVCRSLGVGESDLQDLHSAPDYECHAVGFCPGFPYLGWLDDRIAGLPRRPTPRLSVPVGSVAITLNLTGVYTAPRPGGWWLIGRTPIRLCVPEEGHFPIEVGDVVKFVPVSLHEFEAREGGCL